MNTSEVKACPFCGVEPELLDSEWAEGFADTPMCPECGAFNSLVRWNTRPIEDALTARIAELEAQLAAVQWKRVTARDESLPPPDMTKVEMLLVTKADGDFIAGTTSEQLRRLAFSGNPKIKDYYWRPYVSPEQP